MLGTSITGSQNLFNTTTSKIKNIVGTNLTFTADDNNWTIAGIDAHDKTNIDGKITTINNTLDTKATTTTVNTRRRIGVIVEQGKRNISIDWVQFENQTIKNIGFFY